MFVIRVKQILSLFSHKSLRLIPTFTSKTMSNDLTSAPSPGKCIVWVDCEMTGLDLEKDQLLEVAVILTDGQLTQIASIGPLVIKTPKHVLDSMGEWCRVNHAASGLVQSCLNSQLTIQQCDDELYSFCQNHGISKSLLAGNSVSYDRQFLAKFCPKFSSCLHYRTIDVSTIKELVRIWYKKDESYKKDLSHRALDDIRESIGELKYYKEHYFKGKNDKVTNV